MSLLSIKSKNSLQQIRSCKRPLPPMLTSYPPHGSWSRNSSRQVAQAFTQRSLASGSFRFLAELPWKYEHLDLIAQVSSSFCCPSFLISFTARKRLLVPEWETFDSGSYLVFSMLFVLSAEAPEGCRQRNLEGQLVALRHLPN